ncbi:MAG: permease, partial [Gemmatimonadetes bacterium]|nr:permease [Gemmatimonadota bacterium]NIT87213.1 permease [Gemmatimonadota bacterium]NIU31056.1 permease [Gemmatimonadota bacterium]NIV61419.1 permease [Gemmatimonadota bacterium]NIW64123.1 permease [Gemmatimonadota bacterium]
MALAWIGIAAVARLAPPSLPLIDRSEMSLASFAVSMAIALAAVLVAGLLPSLQALRLDLVGLLGSNGRGGSARGRRRLMDAMVASELALSVILLTGATVMTR